MAEVETNKVLCVLKTYMKSLMNNRFLLICCTPDQFYHFIQDINNEIETLGIIQSHIRSDYDGIVSELDSKYSSWKNCKEKYQGISKEVAISPHTDGTFLEGMFPAKTTMVKISPPKLLLIQPIEYDADGGEIILVDGKKVLESILAKRPKLAKILMKPLCVAFCRDDHMSMNYPVYEHMQDDSIRIHFRYDQTTFAPYWSYEAVKFLHNNYHMNPKCQILIVDNHRMLHDCGEFAGNRKLRRVWLYDDDPIILKNVHDIYRNNRATMPYAPYIPLNINNASKYKKINTGIRLDKSLYNKGKNLSFKSYHKFEFKEFSPVAILYQALQPPIIDGIRKPLKPGGYSDSGADIAYSLRSDNIPIVTPVDNPSPISDLDWVFPDTEEGISTAISKGAKTLWANTILFDTHPLNHMSFREDIKLVGHLPSNVHKYDNKWFTNELIKNNGILVPHAILIGSSTYNGTDTYRLNDITLDILNQKGIRFPAVVKPMRGRGSQGVKKVDTIEQMKEHAEKLLSTRTVIDGQYCFAYGDTLILEEYLEGEEITATIMPPGTYDINFKNVAFNKYWHLPLVKRFNHNNGIAPYSGVVAVIENSSLISNEEAQNPIYNQVAQDCEKAAQIMRPLHQSV
ncbi:carboxylate--amine ligase [Gigaspora margarita]|uniref:Carboxylate--amine ligase n=1 Tax=Gigaspora margarita TaxID=4874 RepID=A0A8H3X254_GIGMA|nr:carboxylate--amine ligase [Gigaspora margarita]